VDVTISNSNLAVKLQTFKHLSNVLLLPKSPYHQEKNLVEEFGQSKLHKHSPIHLNLISENLTHTSTNLNNIYRINSTFNKKSITMVVTSSSLALKNIVLRKSETVAKTTRSANTFSPLTTNTRLESTLFRFIPRIPGKTVFSDFRIILNRCVEKSRSVHDLQVLQIPSLIVFDRAISHSLLLAQLSVCYVSLCLSLPLSPTLVNALMVAFVKTFMLVFLVTKCTLD
jgi:hypothetical protein